MKKLLSIILALTIIVGITSGFSAAAAGENAKLVVSEAGGAKNQEMFYVGMEFNIPIGGFSAVLTLTASSNAVADDFYARAENLNPSLFVINQNKVGRKITVTINCLASYAAGKGENFLGLVIGRLAYEDCSFTVACEEFYYVNGSDQLVSGGSVLSVTKTIRGWSNIPRKLGDVNSSGAVDAEDALIVIKHRIALELITDPIALARADVNKDNKIDTGDAQLILMCAVGRV